MSSHREQHTEWILETIDHLRKRKARPDLQRISHVVRRRFGLPTVVTEAKLEKLVDAEIVIKVDYKGSTSYRNASKWRKSMVGCAVQNSNTVSTKVIEAILELSKAKAKEKTRTKDEINYDNSSGDSSQHSKKDVSVKNNKMEVGVAIGDIESWLTKHCEGYHDLKSPLNVVLKREVDAGRIENFCESGTFVVTSAQKDEMKNDAFKLLGQCSKKVDSKSNSWYDQSHRNGVGVSKKEQKHPNGPKLKVLKTDPTSGKRDIIPSQPSKRGRPPKFRPQEASHHTASMTNNIKISKLKRPATTKHASDDLQEPGGSQPKTKRKNQPSSSNECAICSSSTHRSWKVPGEILLKCTDCGGKAHPSCLKYNPVLAERAAKGPWQCMECKTCCVCHDSGQGDLMLFCDGCDKGFHMTCHMPPVTKKPSGLWECYDCRFENSTQGRNEFAAMHIGSYRVVRDSAPPTPAESPSPPSPSESQTTSNFPDGSKWTVDEVAEYFVSEGFPKEAQVFKDQEIDGVALLLLKRADVLRGLNFKLGPALKVNRIIQGFQTARIL